MPVASAFVPANNAAYGAHNSFAQPASHPMMPMMPEQHSPFNAFPPNQDHVAVQYNAQQPAPMQGVQNSATPSAQQYPSQGLSFDANDSTMFNFDLASMNFGNHYGAMEFGMLGHMASGANDQTFPQSQRPHSASTGGFDDFNPGFVDGQPDIVFNGDSSWPGGQKLSLHSQFQHLNDSHRRNSAGPGAFAIGAGPGSLSGSSPQSNSELVGYDQNGNAMHSQPTIFNPNAHLTQRPPLKSTSSKASKQAIPPPDRDNPQESISKRLSAFQAYLPVSNRTRNSSSIYSRATKPYPYTSAFHALTAVLKRRFPTAKRMAIAKALATIRPSFISCARDLVDDDLIFMEKCFLRGLYDYEDFQHDVCTPTIVCRRTGEVAHVTKEFCIMSGWNREVLLGKKLNRNANFISRDESGFPSTTSSRGGHTTPNKGQDPAPAQRHDSDESAPRQQPVFLAELLDEESVVQFYEDYSTLAFADSKGSIRRSCQVIKYMTKEDIAARALKNHNGDSGGGGGSSTGKAHAKGHRKDDSEVSRNGIFSEEGMRNLGTRDGRVDCMYCWQVKRDVFNIPMMIVLNVSLAHSRFVHSCLATCANICG